MFYEILIILAPTRDYCVVRREMFNGLQYARLIDSLLNSFSKCVPDFGFAETIETKLLLKDALCSPLGVLLKCFLVGFILSANLACSHGDDMENPEALTSKMDWIVIHYSPERTPSAPFQSSPENDNNYYWHLNSDGDIQAYALNSRQKLRSFYSSPGDIIDSNFYSQWKAELDALPVRVVQREEYVSETGLTVDHVPALVEIITGSGAESIRHYYGPVSSMPESSIQLFNQLLEDLKPKEILTQGHSGSGWLRAQLSWNAVSGVDYRSLEFEPQSDFDALLRHSLSSPYLLVPVDAAKRLIEQLSRQSAYRKPIQYEGQLLELRVVDL